MIKTEGQNEHGFLPIESYFIKFNLIFLGIDDEKYQPETRKADREDLPIIAGVLFYVMERLNESHFFALEILNHIRLADIVIRSHSMTIPRTYTRLKSVPAIWRKVRKFF